MKTKTKQIELADQNFIEIQFADIFNIEDIQQLQDLFSDANGVASLITHPDGTPITRPSNFCRLCNDIIRKTEKGLANCYKSDATLGCHNVSGAIIQPCLSGGLWDAGASITVAGRHIANWLIGQVRNSEIDNQRMLSYADEIGANRNDFLEAFNEVPEMSLDRFNKIAKMLFAFANELSEKAYNNLQLKKYISEKKQIQELLIGNEEKYRLLIDLAVDAFFQGDAVGNLIDSNKAASELTGYSKEELLNMNIRDLFSTEINDKKPLRYDLLEKGETICVEREVIRKDGSSVFVEMSSKRMPEGNYQSFFRNINERKRIEDALKESENKYRSLVENSPDAIVIYEKGKVIYANNESLKLIKASCEEELIGKPVIQSVHPDYRPFVIERMKKLENEGIVLPLYEEKFICLDGSEIDVEVKAMSIKLAEKVAVLLTIRDITNRKKSENLLRDKQRQLADIVEFLPDATLGIDKEKRIIIWNKAIVEMTGIQASEMIGKGNYAYTIPFYGEARPQLMDLVFENNTEVISKYPHIKREGDTLTAEFFCNALYSNKGAWIFAKVSPLHDEYGNVVGAIESLRDITLSRQANDLLKESEERFRLSFDNANVGMCLIDIKGRFLKVNQCFCNMFGYSTKKMESMNINDITHSDYHDTSFEYIKRSLDGEIDHAEFEKVYIHKQGNVVLGHVAFSLVRNTNGEPMYFITHVIDITESKRNNDELIKQKYFFEQMFMQSSVSTQILDCEGWCERINSKLSEIFGVEAQNIEGRVYNIFHDEAIKQNGIIPYLEKVFKEGKAVEWEVFFDIGIAADSQNIDVKEKKKVWYSNWAYPIFDKNGKISNVIIQHNNITDRKQAEKSLKENEERFRAVSEYSFSSICIINEAGKIVWANDAMIKMGGYSRKEIYAADSFAVFLTTESKEFVVANFIKFTKGEKYKHHYEFNFIRSDGEIRLCEKYMTHYKDSNGRLNLVISMMDITEHMQIQQALKESEDKYRTMIEYSNDLIWILDNSGNFTFLNEIATKTTGLTLNEWKGKSFIPLILQEDLPMIMDVFQRTINGESCNYELRFKKEDNSIITISVNTSPIYIAEKIQGIVSFGQDITQRKHTEETIKKIGKHYQALIEKAPDGIVLINAEGNFKFASPSAKRMFGYSESEDLTGNPAEHTHPDDLHLVLLDLAKLFEDPSYTPTLQYRFRDKNGNWKWIESTFTNLLADPSVESIVINFRDISERKQDEEALKEKMEDLQRFHNISVGRELKMIELKNEINVLHKQLGIQEKYKIVE
ncbi:MAG: PAS domain S-box protein [Bacteroidetes bacterium]|nr:PAS domain S-box protein [Bacteroidota bacterium]